jgi:hypothetical protein
MTNMPWLFNEDAALKAKLQGLQVFDKNDPNGRNVKVRYRLPETEVANLDFPIIVISHNIWSLASEREHRGLIQLPYAPEGKATWWDDSGGSAVAEFDPNDSPYFSYVPLPYNFDYRVDLYCRFMHEHTIPLVAALAAPDRLDPHFGYLDIPQDGTKRTMQLLGGPSIEALKDENDKRFFQVTYLVRVFSELVPQVLQYALVNLINLDLSVYTNTTDLTGSALTEARGILSAGAGTAWNIL